MVWNSIQAVIILFLITALGYILSLTKVINKNNISFLSNAVFFVAAPCILFSNIVKQFTHDTLLQSGSSLAVPAIVVAVSFGLGLILAYAFKMPKERRGVFLCNFAFSNTIFVGIPVVKALYGDAGLLPNLYCFVPTSLLFWTLGTYMIKRSGSAFTGALPDGSAKGRPGFLSMDTLKGVVSPPLVGSLLGITLVLLGVNDKVPDVLMKTIDYLGALTVPLSILFVGALMHQTGLKKGLKPDWSVILVVLSHAAIMPVLMYVLSTAFGIGGVERGVFVIQGVLPVMTNVVIVSARYNADTGHAAKAFIWTMLMSFLVIPLSMYLLTLVP